MLTLQIGLDRRTCSTLSDEGFSVIETEAIRSEGAFLDNVDYFRPQLIIIDLSQGAWMIEAVRELRRRRFEMPILGIFGGPAAMSGDEHAWWCDLQEELLKDGLMTFVVRGPVPGTLVSATAKMIRGLRTGSLGSRRTFRFEGVEIEYDESYVHVNGTRVRLTPSEVRLCAVFLDNAGKIQSKLQLLTHLNFDRPECEWPEPKIIDVFVCRLRRMLRTAHPALGGLIRSEWARGYVVHRPERAGEATNVVRPVFEQKVA